MRPVQLELTNFGPYRKEVINFTQFDHAPLFLIGGETRGWVRVLSLTL